MTTKPTATTHGRKAAFLGPVCIDEQGARAVDIQVACAPNAPTARPTEMTPATMRSRSGCCMLGLGGKAGDPPASQSATSWPKFLHIAPNLAEALATLVELILICRHRPNSGQNWPTTRSTCSNLVGVASQPINPQDAVCACLGILGHAGNSTSHSYFTA